MDDIFELFGLLTQEPTVVSAPNKPPRVKKTAPVVVQPPPVQPQPAPSSEEDPVVLRVLDCGHTDWYTLEENLSAQIDGHCCAGGRDKRQIAWDMLRGEHVRPIPENLRRTEHRERVGGFPGYCCDEAGFYIGGVGNDCQRFGVDDRRCAVHR